MKIIIPNNIFSTLLVLSLDQKYRDDIIIKEASLITKELMNYKDAVGLIPSLDLIKHRDLNISSKYGIGFDSLISNSYIYYSTKNKGVAKVLLRGDVSSNEVILSKIVFQEKYNINPEFSLDSNTDIENNHYLITGSENWSDINFKKGSSFSEQIADLIDSTYINFIFASQSESSIIELHSIFSNIHENIFLQLDGHLKSIQFDDKISSFIKEQIGSVYYSFNEYENHALNELYQLVYYYGFLDDIFDIKFIG